MSVTEFVVPMYVLVAGLVYGLRTHKTQFVPDRHDLCLFAATLWPIWFLGVLSVEVQKHGGIASAVDHFFQWLGG